MSNSYTVNLESVNLVNRIIAYYFYLKIRCSDCDSVRHQCENNHLVWKAFTEFFLSMLNNTGTEDEHIEQLKKNIKTNVLKKVRCKCLIDDLFGQFKNFTLLSVSMKKEADLIYDVKYIFNGKEKTYHFTKKATNYNDILTANVNSDLLNYLYFLYHVFGMDTGQFWGLPPSFYKLISTEYKNPMECFASPFNHNLENYYSPLKQIDSYFGSKGNFFEEFLTANNDIYVINPPFIETMIRRVFKYIEKKNTTSSILLYLPYWKDLIDPLLTVNMQSYAYPKGKTKVYDYINKKYYHNNSFELILIGINIDAKQFSKFKNSLLF